MKNIAKHFIISTFSVVISLFGGYIDSPLLRDNGVFIDMVRIDNLF